MLKTCSFLTDDVSIFGSLLFALLVLLSLCWNSRPLHPEQIHLTGLGMNSEQTRFWKYISCISKIWKTDIVLNASKWPGVWLLDRHLPMKLDNQHHQFILKASERHLLIPDFVDSIFHGQKAAICDPSGSTKWKGFVQSSAPPGTLARVAYQPLQRWMANWKHLKRWSRYGNIVLFHWRTLTGPLPIKQ